MGVTRAFTSLLVVFVALALPACSGSESTPRGDSGTLPAGSEEELCDSLQSLDETVARVTGTDVDPETTTIGDVEDALRQVQSEVQDVSTSDLPPSVSTGLQGALAGIEGAVRDLPTDETLASAGSSVQSALQRLETAWSRTLDALGCSSPS